MNSLDKQLFDIIESKTNQIWKKKYQKYYTGDSKKFINRIKRDYLVYKRFPEFKDKFPSNILKTIKKIPRDKYDSAVCLLRGALPYALLFESCGWKVHYILCGRKKEINVSGDKSKLRFNKSIAPRINKIKGKKILIIENNSPSGTTPILASEKLKKDLKIKKPDLFLDYYFHEKNAPKWLFEPFWKTKKKQSKFGKIYVAQSLKVSKKEHEELIKEFLEKLK